MTIEISQSYIVYFGGVIWVIAGILYHQKCLSTIQKFNNTLLKLDTTQLVKKYIFTNKTINYRNMDVFDSFMYLQGRYYKNRFDEIITDDDLVISGNLTKIIMFIINIIFTMPFLVFALLCYIISVVLYPILVVLSRLALGKFVTRYPCLVLFSSFANFVIYIHKLNNLGSNNNCIIIKEATNQMRNKC